LGRVDAYANERITPAAGARLTDAQLHADYARWCAALGFEPVAMPTFSEGMAKVSQIVGIKRTRGTYQGVTLRGVA
jgi:hypothetical protein